MSDGFSERESGEIAKENSGRINARIAEGITEGIPKNRRTTERNPGRYQ